MNSFMSWVGGKKALREEVVRRFPLYYERYIEVFGGGGWVLFGNHQMTGVWRFIMTIILTWQTCFIASRTARGIP